MAYEEGCECGGIAKYSRTDEYGNVILKCQSCGDTFDAVAETESLAEKFLSHFNGYDEDMIYDISNLSDEEFLKIIEEIQHEA